MIGRRGALVPCRVLEQDVQNVVTRSRSRSHVDALPHERVPAPHERCVYVASAARRARDTRPSSAWENAIRRLSSAL